MSNDYRNHPLEYINSPLEIEAFTKHIYYLHRQTKVSFTKLVKKEASFITNDIFLQKRFQKNIFKFLRKRKDLNILLNIKF